MKRPLQQQEVLLLLLLLLLRLLLLLSPRPPSLLLPLLGCSLPSFGMKRLLQDGLGAALGCYCYYYYYVLAETKLGHVGSSQSWLDWLKLPKLAEAKVG